MPFHHLVGISNFIFNSHQSVFSHFFTCLQTDIYAKFMFELIALFLCQFVIILSYFRVCLRVSSVLFFFVFAARAITDLQILAINWTEKTELVWRIELLDCLLSSFFSFENIRP